MSVEKSATAPSIVRLESFGLNPSAHSLSANCPARDLLLVGGAANVSHLLLATGARLLHKERTGRAGRLLVTGVRDLGVAASGGADAGCSTVNAEGAGNWWKNDSRAVAIEGEGQRAFGEVVVQQKSDERESKHTHSDRRVCGGEERVSDGAERGRQEGQRRANSLIKIRPQTRRTSPPMIRHRTIMHTTIQPPPTHPRALMQSQRILRALPLVHCNPLLSLGFERFLPA